MTNPTNPLPLRQFAPVDLGPIIARVNEQVRRITEAAFSNLERQAKLNMIAAQALQEVQRAEAKHGRQSGIPDGTGADVVPEQLEFRRDSSNAEWARVCKYVTDKHAAEGRCTRFDILLEEVAEASAEDDVTALRAELMQVIAMGIAWVADIDDRERLAPAIGTVEYRGKA